MVADYSKRLALSKIGYQFDPAKLSSFQAHYLVEVHTCFEQLKSEELKKAGKGSKGAKRGR
jgi:hypothetical protein